MFWKRRNLRLWALCLAASLLLSAGCLLWQGSGQGENIDATLYNTTLPETEPAVSVYGTAAPGSKPAATEAAQNRGQTRPWEPFAAVACVIAGLVLALIYIFSRQEAPLLGPEAEAAGLVLCAGMLPLEGSEGLWLLWAVCSAGLLSLRGLFWWLMNKCPLAWSGVHRLSVRAGTKGRYLAVQSVFPVLAAAALWYISWHAQLLIWSVPFLLAGLLALLCILKLSRDLDHLLRQLGQLGSGEPVAVKPGSFEHQETSLSTIQDRVDEAVQTAVTGERFKVELISNVSHDLRTPLTAILGYGELLEREQLSDQGREQLNRLNQKAGYMSELVESLFELTKVSSGVIRSKRESIDLIRLLEQTIGFYDDKLSAAGLQVRRHYASDTLEIVTDGARMHQVFSNLLGNAIKYALPGTRIHLEVSSGEDVHTVRMTNIASYEMDFRPEEILQRFARGDKSRTTQGSGIGLAIAQTYTGSVGGSFRIDIDGDQFSAIVTLPKTERDL